MSDFEKLDEFDGESKEMPLLALQVPPGKIHSVIKDFVKTFIPDIDVTNLQLPGSTCANYMRREELRIVFYGSCICYWRLITYI